MNKSSFLEATERRDLTTRKFLLILNPVLMAETCTFWLPDWTLKTILLNQVFSNVSLFCLYGVIKGPALFCSGSDICRIWHLLDHVCRCLCSVLSNSLQPCSPPGSSVCGIFQARILSVLLFPSPGDLPKPYLLHLLHWQTSSLPLVPSEKYLGWQKSYGFGPWIFYSYNLAQAHLY